MSKAVLVTGVSGFLASHVVQQLVDAGHRVIGTARSRKLSALRDLYKYYPVDIVEANDLATANLESALKGVDVVIHTATPLPGNVDFETMLTTAIEGAVNVLSQAEKAGIKKIVVTSSVTTANGDHRQQGMNIKNDYWKDLTKEQTIASNPNSDKANIVQYAYAKLASEKAVWKWAEQHPHVAVTTINPSFLYGPFPKLFLTPAPGDFKSLSTNLMLYNFLYTKGVYGPSPGYIDVREAARAHLGAAFRHASAGKRFVVSSPHPFAIQPLLDILKKKRAAVVQGRLNTQAVPQFPHDKYEVEFGLLEEGTGVKKSEFHSLEETFLDTIDSLLELESKWKAQGYIVDVIPPQDL